MFFSNNSITKNFDSTNITVKPLTFSSPSKQIVADVYYKKFSCFYNPVIPGKPQDVFIPEWFFQAGYTHPIFQIRAFIASNKYAASNYL